MNRKVSICMAYKNRFSQLLLTLETIDHFSCKENFEIVVVDYGSDENQRAVHFKKMFKFPIRVIEIKQEEWVNSCIPLNIAIKQVVGDIIIIQNPECFHCGNVIGHANKHLTKENYLSYSCFAIDKPLTKQVTTVENSREKFCKLQEMLDKYLEVHQRDRKSGEMVYWYNHPEYRPSAFHFCSAITRKNIDELGGFDERYRFGHAFDDNELLTRIKKKGLQVTIVPPDFGYVVHQFHLPINDSRTVKGTQRNRKLFYEITLKEPGWKVNA